MKKIILGRVGEISIKGYNRPLFERALKANIKKAFRGFGETKITMQRGRFYVEFAGDSEDAVSRLKKVFGVVSFSLVHQVALDFEVIRDKALEVLRELVTDNGYQSFKVEARRANKAFPMNSMELMNEVGGYLLQSIPGLKVDVHNPEIVVYLEIREVAFVYSGIIPGPGGMPVGTNSKATLLLSGGIDSPVAGWMVMKRGVTLEALHFYSFPFTSERSKEKVIDLCKLLAQYQGRIKLYVAHFTEIQKALHEHCPEELFTIIMRRMMMRIANKVNELSRAKALVTGESIGQVASQTLDSMLVTNSLADYPVFRPLIGMDKMEIVDISRMIGTYETSILPYEDCCTVFVPRHPKTKPKPDKVVQGELELAVDELVDDCVAKLEIMIINADGMIFPQNKI